MVPELAVGSLAIAIVALAQGAGIRPAFPNPDGSRASASRDFLGQGLGNIAGAFFQSTPTGGSLSRTAVSAEGGAGRRTAGYVAAVSVVMLVVVLGSVVAHIPQAVIGGLLFVIGVELVVGRLPDARLAWRAGTTPMLLLAITLVLTLAVPLQWAIIGGTVLSLLAYIGASSRQAELQRLTRDDQGWMLVDDIPPVLPPDEPVLLQYTGPNFFAVATTVVDRLPAPDPDHPGVLVVNIGALQRYSSTMLKQLARYVTELTDAGSGLVLTGVGDEQRDTLTRTGLMDLIGAPNVLPPDPHPQVMTDRSLHRGRQLLAELRADRPRHT
jgi:SulP family sulfate permease